MLPSKDLVGEAQAYRDLASTHFHRYRSSRDVEDIAIAVDHAQEALHITTKHLPEITAQVARARILLAECTLELSVALGTFGDIDEVLVLANDALVWCTEHCADNDMVHDALMIMIRARRARFGHLRDSPQDAEALLQLDTRARALASDPPSARHAQCEHESSLTHLALSAKALHHLPLACAAFFSAASSTAVPVNQRLARALAWLDAAERVALPAALLDAFAHVLDMLSQAAFVGMDRSARLRALREYRGLATRAAVVALSAGRVEEACVLTEKGRSAFWKRAFWLRTPLDALPPGLAARFTGIAQQLDTDADSNDEGAVQDRLRLAQEFEEVVQEVRCIPGHERFLQPVSFEQINNSASEGPVVVFVSGETATEAIILHEPGKSPEHVPLNIAPQLVDEWAHKFLEENMAARSRLGSAQPHVRKLQRVQRTPLAGYLSLLAGVWVQIVEPVIRKLNLQKIASNSHRPRIWIYPVEKMAFIPLHAAGLYFNPHETKCFSDFAVCSYTPAFNALNCARARQTQATLPSSSLTALLVAEPDAPGLPPLPNSLAELSAIRAVVPAASIIHPTANTRWSADALCAAIPRASVLHLACHGQQDKADALQSGFFIGNQKLTMSQIMKLKLPSAQLAFLSACETAKSDAIQPDENITLAAAMVFVGFPSIIATMWSMDDADGPHVAKMVYEEVFRDGIFSRDRVPYALDAAIRKLRDNGAHPSRWATYIHMGI